MSELKVKSIYPKKESAALITLKDVGTFVKKAAERVVATVTALVVVGVVGDLGAATAILWAQQLPLPREALH